MRAEQKARWKLGALLAAVLPVATSIYGEQAERRQQLEAKHEEKQARLLAAQREIDVADTATADRLNATFTKMANPLPGASAPRELCSTLHTSLALLRQSEPTPRTEAVMTAWLTYRDEDDGKLLVCDCERAIVAAYASWLPQIPAGADKPGAARPQKRVREKLLVALADAEAECTPPDEVAYAAEASSPSSMPTPPIVVDASTAGDDVPRPVADPAPELPRQPAPGPERITFVTPKKGARVYFQVPDRTTGDRIAFVRTALEKAGYRVHGIEVVGEKRSPSCAELRYVYAGDTPEAEALADELTRPEVVAKLVGAEDPTPQLKVQRMGRYEGRSLSRVYELWLPRSGGKECQ